jgi:hypothetical protein
VATTINSEPVGAGKAAINGDLGDHRPKVQRLIHGLRAGNIALVTLA